MAGNFQAPPRKKNALDVRKLSLSAPTPGHQGKSAALIFGLYANNPRITVYTGDPNETDRDKNYGKITANLDSPAMFAFLQLLYQAIDAPGEWKSKIQNKNFIFPGGKRSESPVVVSELHVGKDKEGQVYLSVTAQDRPKIKFVIGQNQFHHFFHGDGTPYTPGETSVLFAKGYVQILENVMSHLLVTEYQEPPPRDANGQGGGNRGGQGGGGGYQRQGGGGGGGNYGGGGGSSSAGDMSDEIPF